MRKLVSMRKLLENGVYFGHQTRKWDPKCKPFIYTAKNGVYIIDLNKTQEYLDVAYNRLKEIKENGGMVLFVGTKKQAQQIILDEATRSGSFYINQRWLGGTLTNFKTINKRIKKLIEIQESADVIEKYPKKEQALIRKEQARLENFLGGIKDMKKLPDALVIVDPKEDHNAVAEARKLGIPVFALTDTNCDPAFVDYPIPANDDAVKSIKLMMSLLADAIVEAKQGILQDAYQEGDIEDDITMEDVIINVEKHAEEQEKRRKQKLEERNKNQGNKRGRFNSEKRFINKRNENKEAEDVAEEVPALLETVEENVVLEPTEEEAPKKRGRHKKEEAEAQVSEETPKKRGRPKKVVEEAKEEE